MLFSNTELLNVSVGKLEILNVHSSVQISISISFRSYLKINPLLGLIRAYFN